jgi:hypothetical protein
VPLREDLDFDLSDEDDEDFTRSNIPVGINDGIMDTEDAEDLIQ